MEPLPDGDYDVMIVDAEITDAETDAPTQLRIDVVLTAGSHKGEVVSLRASATERDPITLMGLPARLCVRDGAPALDLE